MVEQDVQCESPQDSSESIKSSQDSSRKVESAEDCIKSLREVFEAVLMITANETLEQRVEALSGIVEGARKRIDLCLGDEASPDAIARCIVALIKYRLR